MTAFHGTPPERPASPPPPPPPPGGRQTPSDAANLLVDAIVKALKEVMPTKQEMADAIRQGTKEAILEADD